MEDREVGELWVEINYRYPGGNAHWFLKCRELVRKLVEERAQRKYFYAINEHGWEYYIPHALKDFGIDPETWK